MNGDPLLLKINKKKPIRITWHGSEECFTKNRKALVDSLGNGSLQWTREIKSSSFPHSLRFTPQFEKFIGKSSIFGKSDGPEEEFAPFFHVFFIYVTNPEEYRLNVRSELSEWFSMLSESNCPHWLIIFDSSRCQKDKKSRTAIMERLRSDFTRFQNRLFESNELPQELPQPLQSTFFASLDAFANSLFTNMQRLKATINETGFSLSPLINEEFKLVFFYWNLGLFEMALNELDLLTRFITDSIRALAQKSDPVMNSLPWLKHLRLLPLDKSCTPLTNQMFINTASENWSLARIQAHLLAHKILLSAHQLNQKVNLATAAEQLAKAGGSDSKSQGPEDQATSSATGEQLNTLQIRHDAVTTILGHARETVQEFEENLLILQANYSPVLLHCLFFVWQAEAIKFGESLLGNEGSLMEVTSAHHHTNFLLHKKCEALFHLNSRISMKKEGQKQQQEVTIAMRWLEQTPPLPCPKPDENVNVEPYLDIFRQFSAEVCSQDAGRFNAFTRRELAEALDMFRRSKWRGHVQHLENYLARTTKIDTTKADLDDDNGAYRFTMDCIRRMLVGESLQIGDLTIDCLAQTLTDYGERMFEEDRELLFDCCLSMLCLLEEADDREQFNQMLNELAQSGFRPIRSNSTWLLEHSNAVDQCHNHRPLVPFPLRIARLISSPPLLHCVLHQPTSLQLAIENRLPFTLDDCRMRAKFLALTKHSSAAIRAGKNPAFRQICSTNPAAEPPNNFLYHLECLNVGHNKGEEDKSAVEVPEGKSSSAEKSVDSFETEAFGSSIPSGRSEHTFQIRAKPNMVGCFRLDSIHVECATLPKCQFVLRYGTEMDRNRLLENVLCSMEVVKPSITFMDSRRRRRKDGNAQINMVAGMRQLFWLALNPGTITFEQPTKLAISLVGIDHGPLEFKSQSGEWCDDDVTYSIPSMVPSEGGHELCVQLYMAIDHVSHSSSPTDSSTVVDQNGKSTNSVEIKLVWSRCQEEAVIVQQFLQIAFKPLFTMKSSNSLLAGSAIYLLDVRRDDTTDDAIQMLPSEATLHQEQNVAAEPVQAQLLNPMPFKKIVANSSFRFIWRLPDSPIGKSIALPHFLKLQYRVIKAGSDEDLNENMEMEERDYLITVEKRLDFPIQKVEYEICARFFSEQSHSVLCRIDQPCELVVSLRSLAKLVGAETVIVSIELDAGGGYWHSSEKHKLAKVKDCGVGQTIFTIVPKVLGHLPYPAISIHKYNSSDHSPSRQQSLNEKRFGERLVSFYRNKGSQIHILAPAQSSDETVSMGSSTNTTESSELKKKSLKSQAKDRLQKLFEK